MNPIERHLPMVMRFLSGTFAMCMAVDQPERKERIPTSSGENPSLAAPTGFHSALRTVMMMEALTKRRP